MEEWMDIKDSSELYKFYQNGVFAYKTKLKRKAIQFFNALHNSEKFNLNEYSIEVYSKGELIHKSDVKTWKEKDSLTSLSL
jgi:hypothetical protein